MSPSIRIIRRSGITLIEVIFSLAIFLISLVAIVELVNIGTRTGLDARFQQEAAFLAQSKMAEFQAGVLPLESQNGVFEEDNPIWQWQAECEQMPEVNGLWVVKVVISRERPGMQPIEFKLSQMILDPAVRGSTLDAAPIDPSEIEDEGEGPTEEGATQTPTQGLQP